MVILPSDAFGKLQRNEFDAVIGWHPLIDHMIDVAATFECLCACRSIRRSMREAAGTLLDERDIERLSVLVFLHDVGKANSGFQAKRWKNLHDIPKEWPCHAGHGIEAFKLFDPSNRLDHLSTLLPVDQMDTWGDACSPLLVASISHHGRPLKDTPADWSKNIWKKVGGAYDPALVLNEMGKRVVELFPQAFEPGGRSLPDAPAFGHLFAGLVQLADWLGSDTKFFPYSEKEEDRAVTARERARKAVSAIGLDADNWRDKLKHHPPSFADTFGIAEPRPIQAAMSNDRLGPLVILESETGSGKTEAALWRFVHLFRAGLVDSLYFALPTRVAASQIYNRTQAVVRNLWIENPPVTVRALPGYVNADGGDATYLPNFDVLWSDNPDDAEAHRRWAAESAKRFLAAPIAVGTVDQALLGALQVRHAHLRHAMLARSLLVVDEVHASDPYMTVLLERLLKAHLNNGGHAMLLSATLGSSARNRYLALAPHVESPQAKSMTFEAACGVPYPAISDYSQTQAVEAAGGTKKVTWAAYDIIGAPDRIANMAIDAARLGAKVLVIRNTVIDAIATLAAIEENIPDKTWLFTVNGVVTLHHSRFSRQDRPVMDKAIEAQLGKQRPPGALIVVGTQTLEQSLDIDADLLITDLCPMDVLLQRIGRLHRHVRPASERPQAFQSAKAWVLTPAVHDLNPLIAKSRHGLGRFHNGGGVYADLRVLEATRELLIERPVVLIPADNRYLVESATHPDRLRVIQVKNGESWQVLGQKIEGETSAQRTVGHLHALDVEQVFGEQEFPRDVQIATRLGAQDRILYFNLELPSAFGVPIKELPVRHHLLPKDLSLDVLSSDINQTKTSLTFRLGEARFSYSRLGLERMNDTLCADTGGLP
ncbi:CRISPR-associated helicase/endonuclease Cas3 [Nitrosospira lacus]|uniref:CRISPR-associated helicase/endonuclease Cas3 n=1 Tax=Nitrosospira lacus TaxID=1288494 RepID=A0A1W6SPM0_9PROT|nr:CRISPR-associated helicase/endonuclease Cas3 [Nitrosospira lacus]ARO87745.1 CRISPR-associated helicase/endonuclease Cas3 [Nitrosospira lacus]